MGTKEQLQDLEDKITKGLVESYRKMAAFKKQTNSPLIVSKDGKVVEIKAENIRPTTKPKISSRNDA